MPVNQPVGQMYWFFDGTWLQILATIWLPGSTMYWMFGTILLKAIICSTCAIHRLFQRIFIDRHLDPFAFFPLPNSPSACLPPYPTYAQLEGPGSIVSSPNGPRLKSILVHFSLKISHPMATWFSWQSTAQISFLSMVLGDTGFEKRQCHCQ